MGVYCARGLTKWTKSEIGGTWTLGYSGFMNNVKMINGYWMPQSRVTWVALPGKEVHQG
jgi:hypothetical protein